MKALFHAICGRIFRADVIITGHAAPARAPTLATSLPSLGPTRSTGRRVCLLSDLQECQGCGQHLLTRSAQHRPCQPASAGRLAARLGGWARCLTCSRVQPNGWLRLKFIPSPKQGRQPPPLRGARGTSLRVEVSTPTRRAPGRGSSWPAPARVCGAAGQRPVPIDVGARLGGRVTGKAWVPAVHGAAEFRPSPDGGAQLAVPGNGKRRGGHEASRTRRCQSTRGCCGWQQPELALLQ